jgi:hypothetical protein
MTAQILLVIAMVFVIASFATFISYPILQALGIIGCDCNDPDCDCEDNAARSEA